MIYLGYISNKINEGGLARNNIFYKYFLEKKWEIKNFYPKNKIERIRNLYYGMFILRKAKNDKIFLHLNIIPIIFISRLLEIKIYRRLVCKIFEKLSERNELIIEVNDLSFEQSKDLELPIKEYWLEIEKEIYNLKNIQYIFASNLMRDYIVEKYKLDPIKTFVIINGGPDLSSKNLGKEESCINKNNKIKYVYAGSMNKGRQIEELIKIFQKNKNLELYLLGIWGDWIKKEVKSDNIIYLGNFEEEIAHKIVSQCDIGLIPYDDTKFYYNLCYPTKASFYITAGIPFLCTDLQETKNVFKDKDVIWFEELKEWNEKINNINQKEIKIKKNNVLKLKNDFIWQNLLKELNDILSS